MVTRIRQNITLYSFKPIIIQVADHDALRARVFVASQQPATVAYIIFELFKAVRKISALVMLYFSGLGVFHNNLF